MWHDFICETQRGAERMRQKIWTCYIYMQHTQIKGEKVKSEELKVLLADRDKPQCRHGKMVQYSATRPKSKDAIKLKDE